MARNQGNVSERGDLSTRRLFFQWASTKNLSCWSSPKRTSNHYCIECNLFSPWYSWTIAHLVLSNNHTLAHTLTQWLATGRWFSPGIPISSTNKTDHHDLTEIVLKVVLTIVTLTMMMVVVVDFYSASSLKQQSAGRHVAPLWYIILISSQTVFFSYSIMMCP